MILDLIRLFPVCRQTDQTTLGYFLSNADVMVNASDKYGYTPLHVAAMRDNEMAARKLLEREDINTNVCTLIVKMSELPH